MTSSGNPRPTVPVVIRPERVTDYAMIRELNEAAFGGAEEADIIEALRAEGAVLLSLVAELDRHIVGHILFSRMAIDTSNESIAAVALAAALTASATRSNGPCVIDMAAVYHGRRERQ